MHFLIKTGLMILLIFTLSPLSWAASPPYLLAKQDYLYDAFFKLEAVDMMGRGTDQLVVLGRDYMAPVSVYSAGLKSWSLNGEPID